MDNEKQSVKQIESPLKSSNHARVFDRANLSYERNLFNVSFLVQEINQFLYSIQPEFFEKSFSRKHAPKVNFYLAQTNRKTLQQILNACLREKILKSNYYLGTLVFHLPRLKSKIYVQEVNLNSLFRFNGYTSILFTCSKPVVECTEHVITDPAHLLSILKEELSLTFDSVRLDNLFVELKSHTQNAILASWYKNEIEMNGFSRSQKRPNINKTPSYALRRDTLSDYYLKFEKFVTNGNLNYPFPKTKIGFSLEDNYRYAPEFQPRVSVWIVAVHKSVVGVATSRENFNYEDWFAAKYSESWYQWVSSLEQKLLDPKDYVPFPIHPWQFTHYVSKIFGELIKAGKLILLKNVVIETIPTSSFRTLMSTKNISVAPYIKLPVSIRATASVRALPTQIVKSAPIISQIVKDILAKETHISNSLNILREDTGLYLNITPSSGTEHLSVIFRENIMGCCLSGDEIAVVVFALFETMPTTNTSLFILFTQLSGHYNLKGTMIYFTKYVDLVLSSNLDLYLIYGIALEAHQQNTLAVFENGHIKRFIVKDLTGAYVQADMAKFNHQFLGKILSPEILTEQALDARDQLLHTVYQTHLGELVLLLADHFSCDEKLFWNIVRNKTEERFEVLKKRVDRIRWKNEFDAILNADWPVRSYMFRRLTNVYPVNPLYNSLKNPLS